MFELTKVLKIFADTLLITGGNFMARIIESQNGNRRIIKMSVNDIIAIVQEYQRIVPRFSSSEDTRNLLSDRVIYIPEDV